MLSKTAVKMKALIFPAQCAVCGELLEADSTERIKLMESRKAGYIYGMTHAELRKLYVSYLCQSCADELEAIVFSCSKCGKQLSVANREKKLCTDCSEKLRLFESCFCVFKYNAAAREMAAAFKYNCRRDKLEVLSFALAALLSCRMRDMSPDAIAPVPVHRRRLKERGYNQAEVIARIVGHALNIPVDTEMLIRNENTKAQKGLSRNQRIMNLQQAFCAGELKKDIKTVLIIDDIYTTGATMEACTEVLLAAGVEKVYGACIFAGPDQ